MCVWPSTGKLLCWTWRRRPPSRWWWSSNLSSSTAPGCFQKVCGRTAAAFCLWPKPALTDLLCGRGRFADHLSLSYQLRLERPVLSPRRAVFRRPFPLIAAANHWAHREVMLPLYQCIHSATAAEAVRPQHFSSQLSCPLKHQRLLQGRGKLKKTTTTSQMFVSFSSAEPFDIPDLPETPETPASTFQSVYPEKEKLARTVSSASALSSSFHFPVSRTNRYQLPHPEPPSHQRIRSVQDDSWSWRSVCRGSIPEGQNSF